MSKKYIAPNLWLFFFLGGTVLLGGKDYITVRKKLHVTFGRPNK